MAVQKESKMYELQIDTSWSNWQHERESKTYVL